MSRQIQTHDSRVHEMEQQRGVDKRRMAVLEDKYKSQLEERNNLLLALWNRLATLCGPDFMQKHSLIDGQLPTMELIGKNLHGFNKSIILAVRTVEGTVGGFRARIRNIEKDLWRDFQTLEHSLDVRAKRLDQLEKLLSDGSLSPSKAGKHGRRSVSRASSHSGDGSSDYARLKSENKLLKAELQFHRATGSTPAASVLDSARPEDVYRSPSDSSGAMPPLSRGYTTSALDGMQQQHNSYAPVSALNTIPDSPGSTHTAVRGDMVGASNGSRPATARRDSSSTASAKAPLQPSEAKWIHRLKELERRLKAEREARLLDRSGARSRLKEERETNEQLRGRLEREKVLRDAGME
ncbi:MAG: hypothetical protein INR71_03645 [Terriglobus roseus]|nr:hypothetical protein [Terriglobus roseus]